jgi:LysM repeat protein
MFRRFTPVVIGRIVAVSACVVAFSSVAASCGGDTLGVATTVVNVTPTNFATIPPVASTAPGTTTTLPAGAVGSEQTYVVQQGDTPIKVASKYGISVTTLLAYNAMVSPSQFPYPGETLKIPPSAVTPAATTAPTGGATTGATTAPGPVGPGCGTRPAGTYIIQKGDSFYSIKTKFCVSYASLLSANGWPDINTTVLLPGATINMPAAGS